MFDKIAEVVIGLLKGIYGITATVVSGVINTVVQGKFIVRQSGSSAVAGTDEVQISDDGGTSIIDGKNSNFSVRIQGGEALSLVMYSGTWPGVTCGQVLHCTINGAYSANSRGAVAGSARVVGWSANADPTGTGCDTGLLRAAAGVIVTTDGSTGSSWIQQTRGRSRVTGDITNITITPAAITGLSATLIAGRKYTGRMVLFCSEVTAADGLRLDFDGGTATATTFIAQGGLTDDNGFQAIARTTALATDTTNTTITGSTMVTIEFCIVCNAAGTFIPRFAKEADAAGAALTVSNGSYMWIEDMPA